MIDASDGSPTLDLRDTDGRPVTCSLFQAQGEGRLWHVELWVEDKGDSLPLDFVALEEIEEGGMYLDEDGSLGLSICRIVDDEPQDDGSSVLDADSVARIRAFAREHLAFRPRPRLRASSLASRLLPV